MYGIEPHECVYCGETPEFTHQFKSIDWPSEIPIKRIGGHCLHCRQEITAQGGGGVAQDGPEALPALREARMVVQPKLCQLSA